jgi:antirestriction protein ArdC
VAYLASWLKVLKAKPKTLYTASKLASQAVDHLIEIGTEEVAA